MIDWMLLKRSWIIVSFIFIPSKNVMYSSNLAGGQAQNDHTKATSQISVLSEGPAVSHTSNMKEN